jgi:hypothetical protein
MKKVVHFVKEKKGIYAIECESVGGDCYFCKYQYTCPKSEYTPREDEDREHNESTSYASDQRWHDLKD